MATLRQEGDLRRRLTYLMLFRTVLISIVLGITILLSWFSDVDLTSASSLVLFAVIGTTYLLTLIYSLAMRRGTEPRVLGVYQVAGDLLIATVLVHVTGGAQSAFTFFFPLSVIAAAVLYFRSGAIRVALASLVLLGAVSVLGWLDVLPVPGDSRVFPSEQTPVAFIRSLGLNLAAIAGLSILASNLGSQLSRASADMESQRSAAADLLTLHLDIVRSLASGLLTARTDGLIQTANRAATELLGMSEDELIGSRLLDVFPGLPTPAVRGSQRATIERSRSGNKQVLEVSVSPLYNHHDDVIGQVVNFQDLTELREMEAQIKRSERLAAIGGLAAGVAHEIRNPLAAISGSVELLQGSAGSDDDSRALMGIVVREIDRLNGLIGELLDYTNPRPPQPVVFDLAQLCTETVQVFRRDPAFSSVAVDLECKSAPIELSADPEKLRQVVWNLLRNAAEAAQQGKGKVAITVMLEHRDAVVSVRDQGPGISSANLEKIFDPFFTTKTRGSGLGLATVHAIVEQHGGSISVISMLGTGTTFEVRLPVVDPA